MPVVEGHARDNGLIGRKIWMDIEPASVKGLRGKCVGPEVVPVIEIRRQIEDEIVLPEKISQAVKDDFPFVDLDAAENVRAMGNQYVGAVVDGGVGKLHQEFRGHRIG